MTCRRLTPEETRAGRCRLPAAVAGRFADPRPGDFPGVKKEAERERELEAGLMEPIHIQSGGSSPPSLAQSNAEITSLARILFELPILLPAALADPHAESEVQIG